MQFLQLTFTALLLAHILAEFPLQSNWVLTNKRSRFSALLLHGLIHWALAWTCLLLFTPLTFLSLRSHLVVIACLVAHILIDKMKTWLAVHGKLKSPAMAFSVDQALHVLTLAVAASVLTSSTPAVLLGALSLPPSQRTHLLETLTVYLAVVVPGGYFIRYLTKSFGSTLSRPAGSAGPNTDSELKNAGLYIGYLERILIVTAILARSATLVGLILTGKSIARFPEFRKPSFAEYFLIGTLLSIFIAILGGLLLQKMLYGSIGLM